MSSSYVVRGPVAREAACVCECGCVFCACSDVETHTHTPFSSILASRVDACREFSVGAVCLRWQSAPHGGAEVVIGARKHSWIQTIVHLTQHAVTSAPVDLSLRLSLVWCFSPPPPTPSRCLFVCLFLEKILQLVQRLTARAVEPWFELKLHNTVSCAYSCVVSILHWGWYGTFKRCSGI